MFYILENELLSLSVKVGKGEGIMMGGGRKVCRGLESNMVVGSAKSGIWSLK